MISLTYTPIQSDIYKTEYAIDNDALIIKMNGLEEIFDFTGFAEGRAEEIITERLPINPIMNVEKTGKTVNIVVQYYYDIYGDAEKLLFEGVQYGRD